MSEFNLFAVEIILRLSRISLSLLHFDSSELTGSTMSKRITTMIKLNFPRSFYDQIFTPTAVIAPGPVQILFSKSQRGKSEGRMQDEHEIEECG